MGRHNANKKSVRFHRQQSVTADDKRLLTQVWFTFINYDNINNSVLWFSMWIAIKIMIVMIIIKNIVGNYFLIIHVNFFITYVQ